MRLKICNTITMKDEMIILGSSSPRRIEMMKKHGLDPIIIKPECEEDLPDGIGMEEAVMLLSLRKALWIERLLDGSFLEKSPFIIAADTVVYKDKIIGKPRDRNDAFDILSRLRADSHYVATGVTILRAGCTVRTTFCEVSRVFFKDYTDDELNAYLDTDEAYDKAGGYAIQGAFGKYIDRIEGDYDNIVGFPWTRIEQEFDNLLRRK